MGRQTAVLFAELIDADALDALSGCFERLREATKTAGGRVVKTIGAELMALFPDPDAAAAAAASMQKAIDGVPPVRGTRRPGLRIGFHSGPVINRDGDVFGDTVNMAARLAKQATREQILTSAETAGGLSEAYRACLRSLYAVELKGKAAEVDLCELVWRVGNDTDRFDAVVHGAPRARPAVLRLLHQGQEIARRRGSDSFTIGRDTDCDLVIVHHLVSRRHCSIHRRHEKFVLADQSSNGTFVTVEGDTEFALHREEFILRRHGCISFGQPREGSEHFIEFFVE